MKKSLSDFFAKTNSRMKFYDHIVQSNFEQAEAMINSGQIMLTDRDFMQMAKNNHVKGLDFLVTQAPTNLSYALKQSIASGALECVEMLVDKHNAKVDDSMLSYHMKKNQGMIIAVLKKALQPPSAIGLNGMSGSK